MAKQMDPEMVSWAVEQGYSPSDFADSKKREEIENSYKAAHPKKRGRKGGSSISDSLRVAERETDSTVTMMLLDATTGAHLHTLSDLPNLSGAAYAVEVWCLSEGKDPAEVKCAPARRSTTVVEYEPLSATEFVKD